MEQKRIGELRHLVTYRPGSWPPALAIRRSAAGNLPSAPGCRRSSPLTVHNCVGNRVPGHLCVFEKVGKIGESSLISHEGTDLRLRSAARPLRPTAEVTGSEMFEVEPVDVEA
jgi:hypothetical protein